MVDGVSWRARWGAEGSSTRPIALAGKQVNTGQLFGGDAINRKRDSISVSGRRGSGISTSGRRSSGTSTSDKRGEQEGDSKERLHVV
jgi:hypothetical protein